MKPLHLCVPILKRYDLFEELLRSLERSSVQPKSVNVIDNGGRFVRTDISRSVSVLTPHQPMGLAESWNWFLRNVPEERLISNDDLRFAPTSLKTMLETPGPLISGLPGNAFSCFIIRDVCVNAVGFFDELISPKYAYFEDCDYAERIWAAGLTFEQIPCGIEHLGSQTLAAATPEETLEHHKKFLTAQGNFIKKWGRMPAGKEQQF